MNIKEKLRKYQQNGFVMFVEFVVVSFIFILFVSFVSFSTQEPTVPHCNDIPWYFSGIPCPPVYGPLTYKEAIPFSVFFLITLLFYVIFIGTIFAFMVLRALSETRKIDKI